MTAIRSPSVSASTWSCVTYTVVVPTSRWSRRISPRACTRSAASRFDRGSSISRTLGSRTSARPSATRCCWPPDSSRGRRSSSSPSPSVSDVLGHAPVDLGARQPPSPQAERHVVAHRHLRIQRVVLEHHRDVPRARRDAVHDAAVDLDPPVVDRLEARQHPQRGRLAGARRPDQHHQLTVGDLERELAHRLDAPEPLRHPAEGDRAHPFTAPLSMPRMKCRCRNR